MNTAGSLLIACTGSVLGFVAGYQWHALSLSQVTAEGILQYEEAVHPALTPTYPPGHYVHGRIYLDGGTAELLGKRVLASGTLTVQTHPETLSYPRITSSSLTTLATTSPSTSAPLKP